MEPKRHRGFASKGWATRTPVAAVHSRRESLGSKGGLCAMDQSEGCIYCRGHAVSLPQRSALTQNTLPPRLRQVWREGWKRFLPLYGGKSLDFSLVPWQEGLIGEDGYECLKRKRQWREGDRENVFLEKKKFVFEVLRDSSLNTQVINNGTKEGDRSAIRMGWN